MICFFVVYIFYLFILYYLLERTVIDNVFFFILVNAFLILKWTYNLHCFFRYFTLILENHFEVCNKMLTNLFMINTIFSILDLIVVAVFPHFFYVMLYDFLFQLYNLLVIMYLKHSCREEQIQEENIQFSNQKFSSYV